jgi:erythrocyte band 7 integral membrane protein
MAAEKPAVSKSLLHDDEIERVSETGVVASCCTVVLTILSGITIVLFFPFSLCYIIKVVPQYERAVIFRLGRIRDDEAKGPGIFFLLPCIDKFIPVDVRTKSFDVPPQRILTKDSVTVNVDAIVQFRIRDPVASIKYINNAANATRLLAQTTLRNTLGGHTLSEILSSKDTIQNQMCTDLDDATDRWGVDVQKVEM